MSPYFKEYVNVHAHYFTKGEYIFYETLESSTVYWIDPSYEGRSLELCVDEKSILLCDIVIFYINPVGIGYIAGELENVGTDIFVDDDYISYFKKVFDQILLSNPKDILDVLFIFNCVSELDYEEGYYESFLDGIYGWINKLDNQISIVKFVNDQ